MLMLHFNQTRRCWNFTLFHRVYVIPSFLKLVISVHSNNWPNETEGANKHRFPNSRWAAPPGLTNDGWVTSHIQSESGLEVFKA